jgi:hypothetical protein
VPKFFDPLAYTNGDIDTQSAGAWVSQVAAAGWTRDIITSGTYFTGKALEVTRTSAGTLENSVVNNSIGAQTGDVEIAVPFSFGSVPSVSYPFGPALIAATGEAYALGTDGTFVGLNRLNGGGAGTTAQNIGFISYAMAANTVYIARIGIVRSGGGDTIRASLWNPSTESETPWNVASAVDATPLTSVKFGTQTYEFGFVPYRNYAFGMATGVGVSAPLSAAAGALVPRGARLNMGALLQL